MMDMEDQDNRSTIKRRKRGWSSRKRLSTVAFGGVEDLGRRRREEAKKRAHGKCHKCILLDCATHLFILVMTCILITSENLLSGDFSLAHWLEQSYLGDSMYEHERKGVFHVDTPDAVWTWLDEQTDFLWGLGDNAAYLHNEVREHDTKDAKRRAACPEVFPPGTPLRTFRQITDHNIFMMGGLLLRQLRASDAMCPVHEIRDGTCDQQALNPRNWTYGARNSNSSFFDGDRANGRAPFTWFNGNVLNARFYGLVHTYSPRDGFDAFLPATMTKREVKQAIGELRAAGWIDTNTSALFTFASFTQFLDSRIKQKFGTTQNTSDQTTAFGSNIDAYLRITHEFTPAGTVETWPAYDTRHNFQTLHKEQKEIMLVFITIGVVAYMIVRIYELCASKRSKGHKKYGWTRMRNYLDFIRPLLFFFAIGHWVNQNYYGYFSMGVPDAGDEVNHIRYCSKYRALETDIQKVEINPIGYRGTMGFFGMLCLWHVLEYLGAFPKLIVPMESITRALPQILSFLVVYLLVVFGWSLLFLSYFGLLTEFSTFTRAFLHLLYISAGDFDIVPLFHETQYEYYGELFIFFFRMMTTIMLLNIFIVIIMEKYNKVKDHADELADEYESQLQEAFAPIVNLCERNTKTGNAMKKIWRAGTRRNLKDLAKSHQEQMLTDIVKHHHKHHHKHVSRENKIMWERIEKRFRHMRRANQFVNDRFDRLEAAMVKLVAPKAKMSGDVLVTSVLPPIQYDSSDVSTSGSEDESESDNGSAERKEGASVDSAVAKGASQQYKNPMMERLHTRPASAAGVAPREEAERITRGPNSIMMRRHNTDQAEARLDFNL